MKSERKFAFTRKEPVKRLLSSDFVMARSAIMEVMMNILIVDDEYYIVQGITKNVKWDKLDIDTIYTAYSMKQAQEIFQQYDIDILLTDIEMPKGSGLDLIEWANENSYHPVKLLLTGHQNFTYAQKAILLQCYKYVVKPVEASVLENELMCAVDKVNENKKLNRAKNIAESWDSNKTLRMDTFWRELYTYSSDEDKISEAMQRLSVPLSWLKEDFYFLLLNIRERNISSNTEINFPLDEITTIISNVISNNIDNFVFKISSSDFLLAIPTDNFTEYQNTYNFCESVLDRLSATLPIFRFSIYLSDKAPLTSAAECYQLLKNFESNIFTTENIVIPVHMVSASDTDEFLDSQLKNIPLTEWSELLMHNKSVMILEEIRASFKKDSSYYPVKMLLVLYYGVLQTVFSAFESKDISMNELFPKLIRHTDLMKATSSIEEFLFWARNLLLGAEEILKINADSASFVESVKRFVKANLNSEDLSRNHIADELHMNADYLSYLFHKQSGQLLSTYIINERIYLAKKLLLTTDLPLQAIADETGFSNSSYFHKQFRKVVGITPQQYRTSGNTASL